MYPHKIFFYVAFFFLFGVFLKSIGLAFEILLITPLLMVVFLVVWILKKNRKYLWFLFLALLIIPGALFYQWDDLKFQNQSLPIGSSQEFQGFVSSNPTKRDGYQEFKLTLHNSYDGSLLVRTNIYPTFSYGEVLSVRGDVQKSEDGGYKNYLAKRGIGAVAHFPVIEFVDDGVGSAWKSALYYLRNRAELSFQRVLPPLEAAFINGLTFGGYSGFGDEFREAMSKSGTTHLVALSGYNISILIIVMMALFSYFFSKRMAFWLTIFAVIGFVVMTGAEASVVRAAIMGVLIVIADQAKRIFDIRNAIMLAGLIMVLDNPKVLMFDIGFQLSFLALLGIIYLKPIFQRITGWYDRGFLAWKENLFTTLSAQLAVAPVLIINFGSFSPVSLLANVAVLEFIPITMGLGFLITLASFASFHLAFVIAWLAAVLLKVEIFLIKFFADISFPFDPDIGWGLAVIYYIVLISAYVISQKIYKKF